MRARNIKPGFFKNPDLADAGPMAQLLCIGLWCMADKEGRLKDQPRVIKAEVFPYYDVDIHRELTVIQRLGHIRRYKVGEIAVIEVINFRKHQSPHHTERGSELPPYDGVSDCFYTEHEIHGELTVNPPLQNGGNPPDSLIPDSLIHLNKKPPFIPPKGGDDTKVVSERKAKATRLPEKWTHQIAHEELATELGLEFYDELVKFKDYFWAEGKVKANWNRTFNNWLRRAAELKQQQKSWRR